MSRIYWDSMLCIYMLENHPRYSARVLHLLDRTVQRGDALFTSYLALGEVLAGAAKSPDPAKSLAVRSTLDQLGFTYLPFDAFAVEPFARLRSTNSVSRVDSLHVSCAAAANIDLFLTGDRRLIGLNVPGIPFIVDFESNIL